jgi:hypothetical protein
VYQAAQKFAQERVADHLIYKDDRVVLVLSQLDHGGVSGRAIGFTQVAHLQSVRYTSVVLRTSCFWTHISILAL